MRRIQYSLCVRWGLSAGLFFLLVFVGCKHEANTDLTDTSATDTAATTMMPSSATDTTSTATGTTSTDTSLTSTDTGMTSTEYPTGTMGTTGTTGTAVVPPDPRTDPPKTKT